MSPEHTPIETALQQAIDQGAFSWRPEVIEHIADAMYSHPPNPISDVAQAKAWIQSPEKAKRERLVGQLALAAHIVITPCVEAAMIMANGKPGHYTMETGFVGKNGEVVSPVKYTKPRTLKDKIDVWEQEIPFRSSLFNTHVNGREKVDDSRIHSRAAKIARAFHLDEFAQAVPLAKGQMALVGPRGYTKGERADVQLILDYLKLFPSMMPKDFPTRDYQGLMSDIRPKPGIAGLYAEFKKNLTFLERLWCDVMYLLMATKKNDDLLFVATVRTIFFSRNGGSR